MVSVSIPGKLFLGLPSGAKSVDLKSLKYNCIKFTSSCTH